MCPSTNTRWCPAPEQVMVLEELYRRGLRTPNASQIQKITAHLSLYGKVQGKNVFYWFQNHKARDRQKLRKKLAKQLHLHSLIPPAHNPPLQGNGVWKEAPDAGEMRQQAWTWRPSDQRTYGHDSTMVGPTFPCCRSKPLQTLQLFPLTSPSASATHHETPTSSFSINN